MSNSSDFRAAPLSEGDARAEWEKSMRHEAPPSAAAFDVCAATTDARAGSGRGASRLDPRPRRRRDRQNLDIDGGGPSPHRRRSHPRGGRDPLKIGCNRIARFKDGLMTPKDAAAWVESRIAAAERGHEAFDVAGYRAAARVYADYQQRLREANAADFGDLLLWPTLAMMNDADYRARWAGKFEWVHADEYQDINFSQYQWLKALASRSERVFAVGDDDQSI